MKDMEKKPRIALFLLDLYGNKSGLPNLTNFVSEEEAIFSQKLDEVRGNSFLAGRTALRIILSKLINSVPSKINFTVSPIGKPELTGEDPESQLNFNISHSGYFILIGITRKFQIGVDIQEIRPLKSPDKIMRRQLTETEYEKISVLDNDLRIKEFFKYWTRKEAVLKASGIGLSFPMNRIDVREINREQSTEVFCDGLPGSFFISDIEAGRSYTAAAALEGSPFSCKLIKLSFKDILDSKFTV